MDVIPQHRADPLPAGVLAPVLHELYRLTGDVESRRAAEDRLVIESLTSEVAALRAAVAHLRSGATPLPHALRPVVARALVDVERGEP